ncbi:MAG TPA: SpoIIE family protein phosphatase [Xanthobacteraceae bacterium]|nr:SpoIIE family protein phosphatase [Xanthobacteraceae bacterium]
MNRNSTVTGDQPMGTPPRILVVDDNDDNLYTLKLHLDLEGYTEVETARDGEEAIGRLKTGAFDLVLLDVMMPRVDGFQVLTWLKDQARLRDLPVIMISALTEMNSMARCIELGAVDYLLKPFNPVLLKARLGATLEKKRLRDEVDAHLARLQEELDAARRLQMAMVPQSFPPPSADFPIDLCASMEPAREVGGDLYDFFVTEDGMLCFLVGDVSGKGMAAALFMARTKSLIRIATDLMRSRDGPSAAPAEIIARVNRELCQNNGDMMFVTLFFAMLRPSNGEVEFCNAGHNAPYRLNGQGLAPIEGGKGIILGIRPDAVYATGRSSLAPGESIYVFTDGVTEAANLEGELFAEARLESVLRAASGCTSAAAIVKSVGEAVRGFVGTALPSDDITMLTVRRLDPSAL